MHFASERKRREGRVEREKERVVEGTREGIERQGWVRGRRKERTKWQSNGRQTRIYALELLSKTERPQRLVVYCKEEEFESVLGYLLSTLMFQT